MVKKYEILIDTDNIVKNTLELLKRITYTYTVSCSHITTLTNFIHIRLEDICLFCLPLNLIVQSLRSLTTIRTLQGDKKEPQPGDHTAQCWRLLRQIIFRRGESRANVSVKRAHASFPTRCAVGNARGTAINLSGTRESTRYRVNSRAVRHGAMLT